MLGAESSATAVSLTALTVCVHSVGAIPPEQNICFADASRLVTKITGAANREELSVTQPLASNFAIRVSNSKRSESDIQYGWH